MFFIANAFKGQVPVFAGQVKIVSHSSSAILKCFCPLLIVSNQVEKLITVQSLYNTIFTFSKEAFNKSLDFCSLPHDRHKFD